MDIETYEKVKNKILNAKKEKNPIGLHFTGQKDGETHEHKVEIKSVSETQTKTKKGINKSTLTVVGIDNNGLKVDLILKC